LRGVAFEKILTRGFACIKSGPKRRSLPVEPGSKLFVHALPFQLSRLQALNKSENLMPRFRHAVLEHRRLFQHPLLRSRDGSCPTPVQRNLQGSSRPNQ